MRTYIVLVSDEVTGERDWGIVEAEIPHLAAKEATTALTRATHIGVVEQSLVEQFELDIAVVPSEGVDDGNEG